MVESKDLKIFSGERIARHCVCCGSLALRSSSAIMMPFISHRVFGWRPIQIEEQWGLKTISAGKAYALCNSLFCEECELLFMDIRFSEDEMSRLYHKYRGVEYTALRDFYEPGYASRNEELAQPLIYLKQTEEFLSKFVAMPETILDWGGDTGVNTPFKNQVSEVIIYDISAKLDEEGTSLSDKHRLVSKTFDLIACCNVLEHVPHPSTVLAEIKEFMTAGTVLFIEVPFETIRVENNSVSALHMKRHWHEHINFYSELSLRRLTYNSGLDVIALRTIATNEKGNQAHVFQLICRKC
jgi:hypothetical protein